MATVVSIGGQPIGPGQDPYIIAELSGNHNGDLNRALQLVEAAKAAGAHAIKLQTYTADTITIDHDGPGFVVDQPLWKGRKLYDLYDEAHTPWDWHQAIFDKGRDIGLTVFSSPFDFTAVAFLETLDVPAYKIASSELIDLPLIEAVAKTGKPLIISTGMGTLEEIDEALDAAKAAGAKDIIVLHCVAEYPTDAKDAYLGNIQALMDRYDVLIGLSDHSMGTEIAVSAVALGACVIEKHFTLAREDGGVDSAFSLEPDELATLVAQARNSASALKGPRFGPKVGEELTVAYRRSLYAVEDIPAGSELTPKNVRSIRPGYGLAPKHYPQVLTKRALCDIARGTPLSWDLIEDD